MSSLKLTVSSWGELTQDTKALKALMRAAGSDIASKTRKLIGASGGGGRLYRGGGGAANRGDYKPGPYRASAVGQAPVAVSGSLRSSLKVYPYKTGEGFAVRMRQFYAVWLESGATGGGNPFGGRPKAAAAWRAGERRHHAKGVYTQRVLLPRPSLDAVMMQEQANLDRRVMAALQSGLTWKQTKAP
jgi:hypothetical protein